MHLSMGKRATTKISMQPFDDTFPAKEEIAKRQINAKRSRESDDTGIRRIRASKRKRRSRAAYSKSSWIKPTGLSATFRSPVQSK